MFLASLIPLAKDSIKDSSLSVKLSMYFSICNRRVLFTKLLALPKYKSPPLPPILAPLSGVIVVIPERLFQGILAIEPH
jgi:hypothetical protein